MTRWDFVLINLDLNLGHGGTRLCGLQQLPLAGNIVGGELCDDAVGNLVEIIRRQSQDGWSGTGQTDTQKTGLRHGGHELQDFSQAWDEGLAVWLVNSVLHGKEDHIRVRWGGTQGSGQQSCTLQIEHLVKS